MDYLKNTLVLVLSIVVFSCTYYEKPPIKVPFPQERQKVPAPYVQEAPNSIFSSYWFNADYRVIPLTDITTKRVNNEDGWLNANETYNGLADFEGELKLEIKAAYDDSYVYILASWNDSTFNAAQQSWLYDGPTDPLKSESTDGWTSHGSDDNLIFEFDMGNGQYDVWKWSLALSEPLGYALDMINDGSTVSFDSGDKMYVRNTVGTDNYAGPAYEWNGELQELERGEFGGYTILGPEYFIYNKTEFVGDIVNGDMIYQTECAECHGVKGDGDGYEWPTGYAMNSFGFLNKFSREEFAAVTAGSSHDGRSHFTKLTDNEKDDLIARIRGFTGVPGYYLENPSGSNSDIRTSSNVPMASLDMRDTNNGYSVLFIRELSTGNNDDVVFDAGSDRLEINFNVYITNGDDVNKVGAENEVLVLKANEL